jgi:hypothetical protein
MSAADRTSHSMHLAASVAFGSIAAGRLALLIGKNAARGGFVSYITSVQWPCEAYLRVA